MWQTWTIGAGVCAVLLNIQHIHTHLQLCIENETEKCVNSYRNIRVPGKCVLSLFEYVLYHIHSTSELGGSCSSQLLPEPLMRSRPRSWPGMPRASASSRWTSSDPLSPTLTGYSSRPFHTVTLPVWVTDLKQSERFRNRAGGSHVFIDGPITRSTVTQMSSLVFVCVLELEFSPDPEAAFSIWPYIWPTAKPAGEYGQ